MVTIKRTDRDDPDFQALIQLLDDELWKRYPEEQSDYVELDTLRTPSNVIIVYDGLTPVACGCFRAYADNVAEIKRMFTHPAHRGRGNAKTVLKSLEDWAREHRYLRIILETGIRQPEAIATYKKSGYNSIPNYAAYVDMPLSVCFEKIL